MTRQTSLNESPSVAASQSRWKRWAFFALVLPIVCLAAYHAGSLAAVGMRQQQQSSPLPTVNGLYIEPQALDLGEVWETPRHTFPLTIRNLGSVARTISRFQTTCSCLEFEPSGNKIAPGEEVEFTRHVDLMYRQPYQLGVAQWAKSVHIDPVFEGDFAATRGWQLNCVVRCRVSIETPQLVFGDHCFHQGPPVTRKVRARAHVPLKSLQALAKPPSGDVRVEAIGDTPGDYFLFISPHPSLPIGPFKFAVEIRAVTMDDVVHPCMTIEAGGEMLPTAQAIPRLVFLGERELSPEAEADVTLRLPANDWKIDHIETDTADTVVTPSKTKPEDGVRLHIKQRIAQLGDQVAPIRIVVRKPDKQVEIVPVEVRYHGQRGHRE